MSTRLKKKQEKILQVIAKLIDEASKGTPVIVEGKKDVDALSCLGVNGKLLTVKTGGKSFLDLVSEVEQISSPKVILLLDFDRRGKEGTKRLMQDFERLRIKPILRFWRELYGLIGREVQCIEGIPVYLHHFDGYINQVSAK